MVACGSSSVQPSRELSITDAENGQSVQVHIGDVVQVTLASTSWTFNPPSDGAVVKLAADPVVSPAPLSACPPGMGCGSVTARFTALKSGTASISATRVSCGEAMRCVGPAGSYQVQVVVS